ncbi:hypothetical protein ASE13_07980 [Sphingomonas sp. Root241]|nr:hypothetical protein ASE13_07980 [Sphingomonas sp. Root241]
MQTLAAKHWVYLGRGLLWLAGLLILVKIAIAVARELRSAQLGVMASALMLLLVLALRASLTSRRRG